MSSRRAASRSWVIAAAALALVSQAPIAHLQEALPAPSIHIDLGDDREHHRNRIAAAATESLRLYGEWLGPLPSDEIRLTSGSRDQHGTALPLEIPWQSVPSAMEIESAVAYRLASRYWRTSAEESHIARGLAWYLQSRAVEQLYNLKFAAPGHSTEALRLFGGFIPYGVPSLRLSRWTGGLAADDDRRVPSDVDADAVRAAKAFAGLERYLGWPVLQGSLLELAKRHDPLTTASVNEVVSAASGQDLEWFFVAAFDRGRRIEYRLRDVTADDAAQDCNGRRCFRSRVTVARAGDTAFTGSSRPRTGDYESGRGVELRVQFADGEHVDATWDGRDQERAFEFESHAPATAVQLDPRGVMLLDPNALDHAWRRTPESNVPMVKWVARWSVWLQNALLTYAMLI